MSQFQELKLLLHSNFNSIIKYLQATEENGKLSDAIELAVERTKELMQYINYISEDELPKDWELHLENFKTKQADTLPQTVESVTTHFNNTLLKQYENIYGLLGRPEYTGYENNTCFMEIVRHLYYQIGSHDEFIEYNVQNLPLKYFTRTCHDVSDADVGVRLIGHIASHIVNHGNKSFTVNELKDDKNRDYFIMGLEANHDVMVIGDKGSAHISVLDMRKNEDFFFRFYDSRCGNGFHWYDLVTEMEIDCEHLTYGQEISDAYTFLKLVIDNQQLLNSLSKT